jgi:hypothetical protein
MIATAGPKHVRCFMYFYIKQVTLNGTILYFNIRQCDGSKCLLLKYRLSYYETKLYLFSRINWKIKNKTVYGVRFDSYGSVQDPVNG